RPRTGYVSRYPSGPAVRGPREHPTRCAGPHHPIVDRTYREEPEGGAGFLRGDGRRATGLPGHAGKVRNRGNAIGTREDCRGGRKGGCQDRKSARTSHGDLREVDPERLPPPLEARKRIRWSRVRCQSAGPRGHGSVGRRAATASELAKRDKATPQSSNDQASR